MLLFIKLKLLLEQSIFQIDKTDSVVGYFIHRRDFRAAKLDPTTGQIVINPVEWVEMKENIEIV